MDETEELGNIHLGLQWKPEQLLGLFSRPYATTAWLERPQSSTSGCRPPARFSLVSLCRKASSESLRSSALANTRAKY